MGAPDKHHWFGITVPDPEGRPWLVRSDRLQDNPVWLPQRKAQRKGRPAGSRSDPSNLLSKDPGFELTSPPLRSARFALHVVVELLRQRSLAVIFSCSVPGTRLAHQACGARVAHPIRLKANWQDGPMADCYDSSSKPAARKTKREELTASFYTTGYHIHVDGSGLCTRNGSCRGLVNLILLHQRYEFVLRRLFPAPGPDCCSSPLRMAAPQLLAALGALPAQQRTVERVSQLVKASEEGMRVSMCYLLSPDTHGAKSLDIEDVDRCARHLLKAIVFRWWSIKPFALLGFDKFSTGPHMVHC